MDELSPIPKAQTLEERVADLEKDMLFTIKSLGRKNQEMIGLKYAVRKAIDFIQKGDIPESISILNHECRALWMTEREEKIISSRYKK